MFAEDTHRSCRVSLQVNTFQTPHNEAMCINASKVQPERLTLDSF